MSSLFDQPGPAEDKPVVEVLDREPPSSPKAWAHYVCHELARHIFKNNTNPLCINKSSITKQVRLRTSSTRCSQCNRHLQSLAWPCL